MSPPALSLVPRCPVPTAFRLFVLLLFFQLLGLTGPILAEESIFDGVDLVVLTGLPGDVESESTYRRQVASFFERLAAQGIEPRRVWWLSDEGEGATLPDVGWDSLPWSVERRDGNRRSLQALVAELAGSRHPLVVLAWGHGGTVASTPVLHVRGPRIEPGDMVAMAHATAGPSRWLLFFRHSGAFARALAGERREILASEHGTAFKSDPVAVDRLLEALDAGGASSFDSLGLALARRTVDWYEEQHLVRQEEPTLYLEGGAPRPLVAELEEHGEGTTSEAVAAGTGAEGGAGEGSAPVWEEITGVDPADYPGFDTVVLLRRLRYTLADRPAYVELREEVVQVLSAAGTRRADFEFAYSPPGETFTLLDAEVLRADGRLVRLGSEAVRDVTGDMPAGYRAPTRKLVTLPEVEVGSILRLRYRREWKTFPLPHVPLEIPLLDSVPVLDSRVEVEVDREAPLHWQLAGEHDFFGDNSPAAEPTVAQRPYGAGYTWHFDTLPAWPTEPLASPLAMPRLLVSTFPSWEDFGAWYRRLVRRADQPTDEMAALAAELTAGATTPIEKVRKLYEWVTALRYIAIPLGVNSHRPHAAANVFENRYGDCKDKANLFNTMLGTLGIDADLVLVPRFSQAFDSTPGLGFNHAISRVRLDDRVIWADTTDEVAPFGLLPPGDPGRRVLVVAEGEDRLTTLPHPRAEDHRLALRGAVTFDAGLAAADTRAELELEAAGYPDYALRQAARHGTKGPLLRAELSPVNGLFSLEGSESSDPNALDVPLRWSGHGIWSGLGSPLGSAEHIVQPPFWWPMGWEWALHARRTPLMLQQGYPLTLSQRFDLLLPEGAMPGATPEPRADATGPLHWRIEWRPIDTAVSKGGRPGWQVRLDLTLDHGELDGEQSRQFQSQARALREAMSQGARYELGRSGVGD